MPTYVVLRLRRGDAVVLTTPTDDGYQKRAELERDAILKLPTDTDATVDVPLADLLPPVEATS